ncbi:MAG: 4-hydroxy-tetrahydrodipicolinate reductase [Bacteroidota bacterium]|nr:4-hydroxy-tetrahydrodipicolinate reductase [Bacteroidota bacterium]
MKIALLGYGKMGKEIEKIALEKKHEVVSIIDKNKLFGNIKNADVAINFSTPDSALENILSALSNFIPVVSGTTGWLDSFEKVVEFTKKQDSAFLYSSNFSIGVNVFFKLNIELAKLMKEDSNYDVSIREIHHAQKIDAPSGTALSLAEDVIKNSKYDDWELAEKRKKNKLTVHSDRKGKVHGVHEVSYDSVIDNISIKHESFSRKGFAKGALLAAEWVKDKKGVFGMSDVLNF